MPNSDLVEPRRCLRADRLGRVGLTIIAFGMVTVLFIGPGGGALSAQSTSSSTTAASSSGSAIAGTAPPPAAPSNTAFPAALVGVVPHVDGGPEIDISDLYAAVSEDLAMPDVVVRFRAPFTLPSGPYRVSVLVGDPTGTRLRASFVSGGSGGKARGIVETGDGKTWHESAKTTATFQPAGFVVVRVPMASAPAGGALWAEITQGNGATASNVTPYFSRDGLLASTPKGSLGPSPFGRLTNAAGAVEPEPIAMPPGPVLRVGHDLLSVSDGSPAPATLAGRPVKDVFDTVLIAPNFDNGAIITDLVRINRRDGTIGLFNGFAAAPIDRSGDRSWVVESPSKTAPSATVTMTRKGIADALSTALDPGTPATSYRVGFGLMRTIVLADDSVVTAGAVLGTDAWFGLGPEPPTPPTAVERTQPPSGEVVANNPSPLGFGAAGILFLVVVALFLARRRAGRSRTAGATTDVGDAGGDRVPWAHDDGSVTARATAEIELTRVTGSTPVATEPPRTVSENRPSGVVIAGVPVGGGTVVSVPEEVESGPSDQVGQEVHDPMAALAALDLTMRGLRSRLDGLDAVEGETPDESPEAPPDAEGGHPAVRP